MAVTQAPPLHAVAGGSRETTGLGQIGRLGCPHWRNTILLLSGMWGDGAFLAPPERGASAVLVFMECGSPHAPSASLAPSPDALGPPTRQKRRIYKGPSDWGGCCVGGSASRLLQRLLR